MEVKLKNKPLPQWRPELCPNYSEFLCARSAEQLTTLVNGSKENKSKFLSDPREVHLFLYQGLTPPDYAEYAGTYRGTVGTALENLSVGAAQVGARGGPAEFIAPDAVLDRLDDYKGAVKQLVAQAGNCTSGQQFSAVLKLFYAFGLIHPFLDGNGHIQRLSFAVAVSLCDKIALRDTWTIHPRPYDIEIAEAFNLKGDTQCRMQALGVVLRNYVDLDS